MTLEHRAFLKQKIIETKLAKLHGKPKMPNLLTWAARAQITYLHKEDPIYWTPEVLADSFPATPAVIKEILRFDHLACMYNSEWRVSNGFS